MKKILILFFTLNNLAHAGPGNFRFIKGQVFVGEKPAAKGESFNENDIISTKKDSIAVLKLIDGSTLKLDENTTVAVNRLLSESAPTEVSISLGSIVVNAVKSTIKNSLNEKFVLKTKSVAMGVRGTTFFATFGKNSNNDIWMCVNEGTVSVKSTSEKEPKLVHQGEGVQVKNGDKTTTPKPLLWTKNINWNIESENAEELKNHINIEDAYANPLEFYYE
jgi:ferric-dicitrate binding protein FerR (iron transport regulator)